jgi:hypothetical protein
MDAVVCYPYIEPNQEWLTIAALCWERVYRVTSRNAAPDSAYIAELNSVLDGFIKPVFPEEVVTPSWKTSWISGCLSEKSFARAQISHLVIQKMNGEMSGMVSRFLAIRSPVSHCGPLNGME